MKIQVRKSVFETNSSSVHAITIADDDEYKGWINGSYIYDRDSEKLITIDEYNKMKDSSKYDYEDEESEDYYGYKRFLTYDEYNDYDFLEYEIYDTEYTTKSGEIIHAFGYYGHD